MNSTVRVPRLHDNMMAASAHGEKRVQRRAAYFVVQNVIHVNLHGRYRAAVGGGGRDTNRGSYLCILNRSADIDGIEKVTHRSGPRSFRPTRRKLAGIANRAKQRGQGVCN